MFQEVQKQYAYLGVKPLKNSQQSVLNIRNVITLIILSQGFITTNVYLLFKANTFNEYVDSFWVSCSTTLAWVNFVNLVQQTSYVFNFMGNFELIIQESKLFNIKKISLKD